MLDDGTAAMAEAKEGGQDGPRRWEKEAKEAKEDAAGGGEEEEERGRAEDGRRVASGVISSWVDCGTTAICSVRCGG